MRRREANRWQRNRWQRVDWRERTRAGRGQRRRYGRFDDLRYGGYGGGGRRRRGRRRGRADLHWRRRRERGEWQREHDYAERRECESGARDAPAIGLGIEDGKEASLELGTARHRERGGSRGT